MDEVLLQHRHRLAQTQHSVACNALHPLEARLGRWLLQTLIAWTGIRSR